MQRGVGVRRPPQWAQEMQVNHDQPFYGVLPDEHDCTRLFQGARISKYVAQVVAPNPCTPPCPPALMHIS